LFRHLKSQTEADTECIDHDTF